MTLALVRKTDGSLDLERARDIIRNSHDIDEILAYRDAAKVATEYARLTQAGIGAVNDAQEVVLRAQRRFGEFLREHGPNPGRKRSHDATISLDALGVDKHESSRCQKLASVSDDAFEQHVAAVRARGERLTTAGAIRVSGTPGPAEPEPFHPLVAAGDFKDVIRKRVMALVQSWPESARGMVPVLLHDLADEIADGVDNDD